MPDFDVAADTALMKIGEFSGHVEKAQAAFAAFEEQLDRLRAQVDADWAALGEAVSSYLEKAGAQGTRLGQEHQEAEAALGELRQAVDSAQAEGQTELSGAKAHVAALGEQVEGTRPQVDTLAEQAEGAARGLAERASAIQDALDEALSQAREFLEVQVVGQFKEMSEEIERRAEALQTALADECETALEQAQEDLESKLDEVDQLADGAFGDARRHVEEVLDFSISESVKSHEQVLGELAGLAGELETAVEALSQATAQRKSEVEQGQGSREDARTDTDGRLNEMIGALNGVKDLLASFTFVEM
jgi:DNA repair exonuclease SbcCD ATPase subunit